MGLRVERPAFAFLLHYIQEQLRKVILSSSSWRCMAVSAGLAVASKPKRVLGFYHMFRVKRMTVIVSISLLIFASMPKNKMNGWTPWPPFNRPVEVGASWPPGTFLWHHGVMPQVWEAWRQGAMQSGQGIGGSVLPTGMKEPPSPPQFMKCSKISSSMPDLEGTSFPPPCSFEPLIVTLWRAVTGKVDWY